MKTSAAWIPTIAVALFFALAGCAQTVDVRQSPESLDDIPSPLHRIAVVSRSEREERWTAECDTCFVRALESAGFEVELFRKPQVGERAEVLLERARAVKPDAIFTISRHGDFGWSARFGSGPCATARVRLSDGECKRTIWEAMLLIPIKDLHAVLDPDRVCEIAADAIAAMRRDLRQSE